MAQLRMPLIASPSAADLILDAPFCVNAVKPVAPSLGEVGRQERQSMLDLDITLQYLTYRNTSSGQENAK
jgi:hypothetical protein